MDTLRRIPTRFALLAAVLAIPACMTGNRAEGDSCACSNQCEDDLYCTMHEQPSEVDGTCGEGSGECRAYRQKGEACSADRSGPERCAAPLICRPFDDVCGDRLAAAERCDPKRSTDCASGMTCNAALEPPQCSAPGAEGDPCTIAQDCAAPLLCNTGSGRCASPGSSAKGGPCGGDPDCASALLCNTGADAPSCIAPFSQAASEQCNQDNQCASHHCITWSGGQSGTWIGECS